MGECGFTRKYWDYKKKAEVPYSCQEDLDLSLSRVKCILHDENYLRVVGPLLDDRTNKVITRVMDILGKSEAKQSLFFIGCYLPAVTITGRKFTEPAYFNECKFLGEADFRSAKFSGGADFHRAKFSGVADFQSAEISKLGANPRSDDISDTMTNIFGSKEFSELGADFGLAEFSGGADFTWAEFSGVADFQLAKFSELGAYFGFAKFLGGAFFRSAEFSRETNFEAYFNYVLFEDGKKILFGIEDLSGVSFMNTDITRVRFNDRARWGKQDKFKVLEEVTLLYVL